MILLFLLSRFWEFLKQIFSANLAWSKKLPSVSLVCLVSFLAYCFPPREVMSLQIWFVFRKVYQVIQSESVLLSVFVFLTPNPAHTAHQCNRNRILLHFKQIFTKEKNPILKLLGTSDCILNLMKYQILSQVYIYMWWTILGNTWIVLYIIQKICFLLTLIFLKILLYHWVKPWLRSHFILIDRLI